jgi:hypothetical protein
MDILLQRMDQKRFGHGLNAKNRLTRIIIDAGDRQDYLDRTQNTLDLRPTGSNVPTHSSSRINILDDHL